jgi:hypothetical protein
MSNILVRGRTDGRINVLEEYVTRCNLLALTDNDTTPFREKTIELSKLGKSLTSNHWRLYLRMCTNKGRI